MAQESFPIAVALSQLLVVGFFFTGWWRTRARTRALEAEAAAHGDDFYAQTGGARLDSFNATIPFASVVVTGSRITLTVFGREHFFDKSAVRALSRHRGFISTGLRIEHGRPEGPSFVVFWTTNFKGLRAALERLGYVVGGT